MIYSVMYYIRRSAAAVLPCRTNHDLGMSPASPSMSQGACVWVEPPAGSARKWTVLVVKPIRHNDDCTPRWFPSTSSRDGVVSTQAR